MFGSGRREWMRGLGLDLSPVGTGEVLDVCLCFGCSGEWAWTRVWRGGVMYV